MLKPLYINGVSTRSCRYAVLVIDVNQNALEEGQRLWGRTDATARQEGTGMLSSLLPASWRKLVMHNYAADILVSMSAMAVAVVVVGG